MYVLVSTSNGYEIRKGGATVTTYSTKPSRVIAARDVCDDAGLTSGVRHAAETILARVGLPEVSE